MKKRVLCLVPFMAMILSGCSFDINSLMFWKNKNVEPEQQEQKSAEEEEEEKQEGEQKEEQTQKKDFTDLYFPSVTLTYDGEPHYIRVVGAPKKATISYGANGNTFTNAGVYPLTATVSCEGYNTKTLKATLTIEKADFVGIVLDDDTLTYDGQEHSITPYVPSEYDGATITYGSNGNTFSEVGIYEVSVTISMDNYNDWTGTATLHITDLLIFEGITFSNDKVIYDGDPHSITPYVPAEYAGATISYGPNGHTFTEVGKYTITATVSMPGYLDWTGEATLKICMIPLMIADFEGVNNNELGDRFKYEFYENTWKPTQQIISVVNNQELDEGSSTLQVNTTHNGADYKLSTLDSYFESIKTGETYPGFSLNSAVNDIRENSTVQIKVQFWFKDLPLPEAYAGFKDSVYITYTLDTNCSTNWTHWEIPFDDPSMSIMGGALSYETVTALGYTVFDFIPYLSSACVLVKSNFINYEGSSTFIDNLCLGSFDERLSETIVDYNNKVYTIASNDNTSFKLSLANGNARFESLNLKNNIVLEGTYSSNIDKLYLNVSPDSGVNNVVFEFDAKLRGSMLSFAADPSGDTSIFDPFAEHINFEGKSLSRVIKVDDFESYDSTGQGYDRGHRDPTQATGLRGAYYGEVYNTNQPAPGPIDGAGNWSLMNDTGGSGWNDYIALSDAGRTGNALSIYNNSDWQTRYMTFGLMDGSAQPLGNGSYFSFFVKGSVAQSLWRIRIYYVNKVTSSNQQATSGDCAYVSDIPVTTDWSQVLIPLQANKTVYGIMIHPTKTNGRLYIDDMEIIGEGNPYASYVVPTISEGNYCLWNSESDAYSMVISNTKTTATLSSFSGSESLALNCVIDDASVTFTDQATGGENLTISSTIAQNNVLLVNEVSGALANNVSTLVGSRFFKYAPLDLDFSDGTVDAFYNDGHWSGHNEGSSSPLGSLDIRSKTDINGNKVINMYCVGTPRVYTYSPELLMGPINHLSIDLGNYFGSGAINYKIFVTDMNGNDVYIAGDADTYVSLPRAASNDKILNNFTFDFNTCIGAKLNFVVQGENSYIYIDNVVLSYVNA